jgi:hypothetical protein
MRTPETRGPLEPLVEPLFEPRSIHSPYLQRRAIAERQNIVAVGVLHELVNEVKVDNVGPVNAKELTGIELGLETAENLTVEIGFSRSMNRDVHACRGDPSNFAHINETDSAAVLERQPVHVVVTRRVGGLVTS